MDQMSAVCGLRCIVYCSHTDDLWSDTDLTHLVEHARSKNTRHGITGLITYRHRQFVQVLEGPEPAVEELFSAIERDVRHCDLRLLLRRNVTSRAFADWGMALVDEQDAAASSYTLDSLDGLHAVATLARHELDEVVPSIVPPAASSLRQPAQQARARDTVQRIFRSARSILLSSGEQALTVPRLAQDAGVSQPTFYRYFADINELIGAALLRVALRRAEDWAAIIDAHHFSSDANLADVLTALGTRNFMKIGGVPPALARSLLPRLSPLAKQLAGALAPAVLRAIARCNLAPGTTFDEETMTALLAGMLSATIVMATLNIDRLRTEQTRRMAAGMFLGGLRASCRINQSATTQRERQHPR
jgi:AcrR family transcriptional regulator